MDYDENDFQNQNFELTKEDTSKFPSILLPFSLPKFDIDEPLHVPVRFDSLAEPDCLFTITGLCSGSNWINDFSPQNSTTKSKNVWSEATSSESVEMLLKSVREEKPIMDSGVPRETLNGTDYSHMMDMDPSGSMLDHSNDRQMRSSAEECITEEKHIENSLDSTKLPESSEGLLEAITYPIRNLNKEMQNKEISPLAERYGIDAQFENVSYPRIGTPLVRSGEENKELSDEILNMGEKEKAHLETEQLVKEDCENTKDLTSSIDERKQKDMAAANDEQGVIGKETSSKERDLTSITDNVVSDGMVHDSLKSKSNEQVTTRDGSVVGDAMKEQSAGSDRTAEVETPPSMPAQDSMRPSEHSSGKGKEASTDLSDSVMAPEAANIGSVSKETLPPQADGDKILTPPPPSMEGKSSPMASETDLDIGIGKANAISADEAQGSNPCTEDVAKDDTITAGTGTDNNQSSTELTCGSPTIISGRLDETKEDGVLDDLAQDANKAKHGLECSNRDTIASEDDKSFSFNVVANIPERETVPNWKPFPSMKSPDIATPSKGSSKGGALPGNTTKNKYEATNVVNTPKTEEKTPDPSPKKKHERKKTQAAPSPIKMEPTKKRPPGSSGRARVKTPSSASGLPDLSASASSTQLAQQPFTDLQHVQLRAQIFAYGSLIQGVPPSETYMVSAFGDSGAGRKKWEAAWRTAMERYQNQKSPLSASSPETPGSSQPVHRSTESASKESAAKRKSSAPGKKASTKSEVPTTLTVPSVSPILPASLPRGTHLDFTQNVSPSPMFNPYQPLQVKHQPSGTGTPWLSPSHPNPWLLSTQSSVFKTTTVSPVPTAATISTTVEASKITPRRKTPSASVPLPPLPVVFPPTNFPAIASAANTTASIAPVSAPSNVIATVSPPASIGATDTQKITVVSPLPTVPPTTTPKTRKRKKAPGTPATEPEKLQVSSPMALIPTSSSPSTQPKIIFTGQLASGTSLVTPTSPIPSYPVVSANISVGPSEHNKTVSEDTSSRIEQSKLHAEDAAAHAAAAVRYSQSVWSQLGAQRNSGLTSDVQQKLASAAVAAAAAAAVAKAAAAAAKVASEAALQAKMMAEESVRPPLMSEKTGPLGSVQASFISMARETAKQRVEATSAAAKRAENLDAVIRAAEVAAEAVSQAGVVVAMGDPLPLGIKDLLEAGPEGYWKAHFSKTEIEKQLPATTSHLQLEIGEARPENQEKVKEQSLSTQKVPRNTEAGKATDVPVASEKDFTVNELPSAKEKEIGFQKGSQIEVFADEASHKGVWFHATVLDVEENRIHVCYTDRFADEAELGQVKEWIVLRNEGDKPPRVRAAHPATGPKPEGTRKRRREAVGTSSWDVGDHVDAWIRDGWREGIVTEKSDGDGTKYTVQFLVAGGSSVVESWHLRPSLIWQDGQWSLWSRSVAKKTHPKEGESPYEKRQRFGQLESDPNQATTAANANPGPVLQKKSEDSRPLNLPADDKVLTMGKFTMGDPNSKRARAGSQKEGSRVVFGVPRPGKKKKYMDVSKHYDGGKPDKVAATATEANSNPSVKPANYLMPQNRAPKSKAEPKAKEAADSKQRAGVKSGKSHALNSSETSLDSLSEQRVPPRKKLGMSHEHDVGGKGKAISSAAGNADSSLADSSEPRRSNRRIQPTSRLLEGLQSSLMIAKVPTDKGTRTTLKGGVPSKDRVNG
ncbi:G2484-1 protein isoform X2 [Carex rostrata]